MPQVKVWRLPEEGQELPSSAGLMLGPGGGTVDMLQFHPTADGILTSGVGKRVTVWDVGQQQPLAGRHSPVGMGTETPFLSEPSLVSPALWGCLRCAPSRPCHLLWLLWALQKGQIIAPEKLCGNGGLHPEIPGS